MINFAGKKLSIFDFYWIIERPHILSEWNLDFFPLLITYENLTWVFMYYWIQSSHLLTICSSELPFLVLGLLFFEGGYILYCGTPTFWQRGLWDSCFQNPSESSGIYETRWGKSIKWKACWAFYQILATCLINSIIEEHEC